MSKKKTNLPEAPQWGVDAFAKAMGITTRTARAKLRSAKVKKDGAHYDFKNKSGVEALVKQFTREKKPAAKKAA